MNEPWRHWGRLIAGCYCKRCEDMRAELLAKPRVAESAPRSPEPGR
jgi:hypothetical protein